MHFSLAGRSEQLLADVCGRARRPQTKKEAMIDLQREIEILKFSSYALRALRSAPLRATPRHSAPRIGTTRMR
jgi:hypothetical protein